MRIIHRGELYDTGAAECCGTYTSESGLYTEKLFRTDFGKYFIWGCAIAGGSDIVPISEEKAQIWAKKHSACLGKKIDEDAEEA